MKGYTKIEAKNGLFPIPSFNINESMERLIKIIQELATFGLPPLSLDYGP